MRISSLSISNVPMPRVASSVPARLREELLRGRPNASGMADILSTPGALGAEHPFPAGETPRWHGGDPGEDGVGGGWCHPAGWGDGREDWGWDGDSGDTPGWAGEGKEGRDGEMEVDGDRDGERKE